MARFNNKRNNDEIGKGLYVEVHNNDLNKALRKFKKKVAEDGILQDLRKREFYESRGTKRRKAKEAAIRRYKRLRAKRSQRVMYNHLYALGCSWTEGTDDEQNRQGWVGRLAEKLECTFTNLGGKGDSNWLQYYNFLEQPIKDNSIVIWGLSSFTRIIGKNFNTIYAGDYDKTYLLKYHNDKALQFQTITMLHSFQQYCINKNCEHLTFISFDDIDRINGTYQLPGLYQQLDTDRIITDTNMKDAIGGKNNICADTTKLLGRQNIKTSVNLKYFSKDGHPNAKGYELWAEHLYRRIYAT